MYIYSLTEDGNLHDNKSKEEKKNSVTKLSSTLIYSILLEKNTDLLPDAKRTRTMERHVTG